MPPDHTLQVALPVPLPRLFDYLPPIGQAASPSDVGKRVSVMFGNRALTGFVAGVGPPSDPGLDLRPADALLDAAPLLHGELLESLHWLARYTHAPLGEVVATALPVLLRQGEPLPDTHAWHWRLTEAGLSGRERLRAGSRPRRLADLLAQHGTFDEDVLDLHLDTGRATARDLGKRGLAERFAAPPAAVAASPRPGPALNDEQQAAADAIIGTSGFGALLLDGVTGSGKTEVYLHAIADCLRRGRQALVLVPEIGLTPQTLSRFRERLGVPVHALHSGLNDGERARTWAACLRGEARVIVGTRSAVFTPLPEAGLIGRASCRERV